MKKITINEFEEFKNFIYKQKICDHLIGDFICGKKSDFFINNHDIEKIKYIIDNKEDEKDELDNKIELEYLFRKVCRHIYKSKNNLSLLFKGIENEKKCNSSDFIINSVDIVSKYGSYLGFNNSLIIIPYSYFCKSNIFINNIYYNVYWDLFLIVKDLIRKNDLYKICDDNNCDKRIKVKNSDNYYICGLIYERFKLYKENIDNNL